MKPRTRAARLAAFLATAAVALAAVGQSAAAPAKVVGTVGPGATISLKKGGARVATLKSGRYTFVIQDRSAEHNFRLKGPVSKVFTSVAFTGTKTVTLNLKPGKYTFVCDPHASNMRGSFRVV